MLEVEAVEVDAVLNMELEVVEVLEVEAELQIVHWR